MDEPLDPSDRANPLRTEEKVAAADPMVEAERTRREIGYLVGVLGLVIFVLLLTSSLCSIPGAFSGKVTWTPPDALTGLSAEHWFLAALSANVVVHVAGFYFAYALMRAAERLMLPISLLPEQHRVALAGLQPPSGFLLDIVRTWAGAKEAATPPGGPPT